MDLKQVKAEIKALDQERIDILKEREQLQQQIADIKEKYQPERRGNVTFGLPGWVQRKITPLEDGIAECNDDLKQVHRELSDLRKLQYDLELQALEPRREELRLELAEKVKAYNKAMEAAMELGKEINRFVIDGNAEVGSNYSNRKHTLLSSHYEGNLINFDRVPFVLMINGRASVAINANLSYALEQEAKRNSEVVV